MVPHQFPFYRLSDRQAELESNSVVSTSPVRAGTKIHSIFPAGLLMLILENTPLLSQTLPQFLLKRAEDCKETAICTEVTLSKLIRMQGKKYNWL